MCIRIHSNRCIPCAIDHLQWRDLSQPGIYSQRLQYISCLNNTQMHRFLMFPFVFPEPLFLAFDPSVPRVWGRWFPSQFPLDLPIKSRSFLLISSLFHTSARRSLSIASRRRRYFSPLLARHLQDAILVPFYSIVNQLLHSLTRVHNRIHYFTVGRYTFLNN